jgi:hypothetical protein
LGSQDGSWAEWVERSLSPAWLPQWAERAYSGSRFASAGLIAATPPGPLRVGRLSYPGWGASRPALGLYLVSDSQLQAIRARVYQGGTYTAQPLTRTDGKRTVGTNLWMLPARPLQQIAGSNGPELLVLTCERFFGFFRWASITVTAGTTTWAQWFAAVASALGWSVTVDPVPAAYLKPSADLASWTDPLPHLLDAGCRSVGMRFVRFLDGTMRILSPGGGWAQYVANASLLPRQGGGEMALVPG